MRYKALGTFTNRGEKMAKKTYYNPNEILKANADYNLIIGERSNGKTYAILKHCISEYWKSGKKKQFAYVRRWKEDVIGKRAEQVFSALVSNGEIGKITKGEFNTVKYGAGKFTLANWNDEKQKYETAEKPFCFCFALSEMEHDKSTAYPSISNIVFDEFITRRFYLPDEFVLFMNVVSTIVRDRQIDRIFLLGNTVNKYNPYFENFGISKDLVQGEIVKYNFAETVLAIEYCASNEKSKVDSNRYFAFDNPKLQMIKGGKWELDIYPHLPYEMSIQYNEILFTFYLIFDGNTLEGNIVSKPNGIFIFFHRKTREIKDREHQLIFSLEYSINPLHRRQIHKPIDAIGKKIALLFATDKVFYQSNEIGEIVRNFLIQSKANA